MIQCAINDNACNGLIGATGYVGGSLLRQFKFSHLYSSSNITEICEKNFSLVVCSAAPAKKWIANREPEIDLQNIRGLIKNLKTITCDRFVLISTVDVFKSPVGIDESSAVDENELQPYGLNRRYLEKFVQNHFSNHLIVRLSGLVGSGLRKNVIFDFLNNNNLQAVDSRGIFQFYPMVNFWYDIQIALQAGLSLVHLTAEPIAVAEVSEQCFGKIFQQELVAPPATYDLRTQYADLFGGSGYYQYSKRESIQAIRMYSQSESISLQLNTGKNV